MTKKYEIIKRLAHFYFFELGKIRTWFYTFMMKEVGKDVFVFPPFRCTAPEGISIGDNVVFANNCVIGGQGGLSIGSYVMIGNNSTIITANHGFSLPEVPMIRQKLDISPVAVGDDVWIGANVVILPGVKIGQGAVIGAGSIVTKDVEPYAIVAGNPAKLIRKRFGDDLVKKLLSQESPLYEYYKKDHLRTSKPTIYLNNQKKR